MGRGAFVVFLCSRNSWGNVDCVGKSQHFGPFVIDNMVTASCSSVGAEPLEGSSGSFNFI